jgi:hypothetical protein
MNAEKFRLSKTTYCKGLNCVKALWLHFHKPEAQDKIDSYKRRLFEYGHSVGRRATESYAGGVLIDVPREEGERALQETTKALAKAPAIFEGAFFYNNVLVRVDILERNSDNTWDLIEVKSSSQVKPNPHYGDLAIQKWVLTHSGIQIKNSYIMLPTRGYSPKGTLDSSGKFVKFKLDHEIEAPTNEIEKNIQDYLSFLKASEEPIKKTGDHCKRPYTCEYKTYCWKQQRKK